MAVDDVRHPGDGPGIIHHRDSFLQKNPRDVPPLGGVSGDLMTALPHFPAEIPDGKLRPGGTPERVVSEEDIHGIRDLPFFSSVTYCETSRLYFYFRQGFDAGSIPRCSLSNPGLAS